MSIFSEGTYPVRFHLRALGATSVKDGAGRFIGWRVPDEHDEEARRLIASAERGGYDGPRRRSGSGSGASADEDRAALRVAEVERDNARTALRHVERDFRACVEALREAQQRAARGGFTVPPSIRAAALAAHAADPLAAIHAARTMAAWVCTLVDAPQAAPAPAPAPRTFAALAAHVDIVDRVPGDAADVPADEADAGPEVDDAPEADVLPF